MAYPRHAPANPTGNLTGIHLFIFRQQLNDREGHWIPEQAAKARLPVASFFHATRLSRFRNSENMKL